MNKLLMAPLFIGALTVGVAQAADIPARRAGPAAVTSCAAAQFQGVYVGLSGGGVYHEAHRVDADSFLGGNSGRTLTKWGGIAGGQAGYNFTNCNTLWGIEIDGSWVGAKNTFRDSPNTGEDQFLTTNVNALLTARVRAGLVLDSLLLYVTGGVAGARFRTTWADLDSSTDGSREFKEWRWGWTAGFGTEWAWSPNISIKTEVLYASFADRDLSVTTLEPQTYSFRHSDSIWISRIGLNYRWGGAARY